MVPSEYLQSHKVWYLSIYVYLLYISIIYWWAMNKLNTSQWINGCESWAVKKAECRRIDAFELWCWRRLLSIPWTARRSNQSILKSWVFGRNDGKTEAAVVWPSHAKSWLTGKDSHTGRNWQQEEKGMTEDEIAGWHHWLDQRESEWTLGAGDGQGGLVCCSPWGHK